MLMCVRALSEEHLVREFPQLLQLKTTTVFFSSTPINNSQSRVKSTGFVPRGYELNLDCAPHWLCDFGF